MQLGKRERPASGCVQVQGPGRSSPHFARYRARCRTWTPPVFPLLLDQSISPCPSIRRPPGRRAPLPPLPPTQKPQLVLTLLKLSHSHSDSSASRPSPSPTIRVARPLPSAVIAPGPPSGPLADRSQNASADLRYLFSSYSTKSLSFHSGRPTAPADLPIKSTASDDRALRACLDVLRSTE